MDVAWAVKDSEESGCLPGLEPWQLVKVLAAAEVGKTGRAILHSWWKIHHCPSQILSSTSSSQWAFDEYFCLPSKSPRLQGETNVQTDHHAERKPTRQVGNKWSDSEANM